MAFDQAKADEIVGKIAGGLSMVKACKAIGQDRSEVYEWLNSEPTFADSYARADQVRAAFHADDIEDVADDVRTGKLEPNAGRVVIDAKKWVSSKLHAKRYGDRLHTDNDTRVEVVIRDLTKE